METMLPPTVRALKLSLDLQIHFLSSDLLDILLLLLQEFITHFMVPNNTNYILAVLVISDYKELKTHKLIDLYLSVKVSGDLTCGSFRHYQAISFQAFSIISFPPSLTLASIHEGRSVLLLWDRRHNQ